MKIAEIKRHFSKNMMRQLGYAKRGDLDKIIVEFIKSQDRVNYIQIGAHMAYDSLNNFRFQEKMFGVLLEPQKEVVDSLKLRFATVDNVKVENAAVVADEDEVTLYQVKGAEKACWQSTMTSFDRDLLKKQMEKQWFRDRCKADGYELADNVDESIVSIVVQSITVPDIMTKYNLDRLDILFTDAEGADFDIIYNLNFSEIRPKLIYFESMHIPFKNLKKLLSKLSSNNYDLFCGPEDNLAILRS